MVTVVFAQVHKVDCSDTNDTGTRSLPEEMEKGKLDDALYSTLTNGAREDALQWRVKQRETEEEEEDRGNEREKGMGLISFIH